ncbi:MAG TPA: pirin family protein, partial [Blastocatellia bacterium]|nr:pirin family protein [Blastocatellia bacterium]
MTDNNSKIRNVAGIVNGVQTPEGDGMIVRRPFPKGSLTEFDPFLLLDEMGPLEISPDRKRGFPDHPHRGFETVTYVLAGGMEHKDSVGHSGKIMPGDVQWMTAGAGIVHSEMPEAELANKGGRLHGFQLWVNLPKRDKMMPPRYQEISAAAVPQAQTADGSVRVKIIAGESLGQGAVIETRTPIMYLHFTLQPGASMLQPVKASFNAFAYVIDGDGLFGGVQEHAGDGQMILFDRDGDEISINVSP